MSEIFFKTFDNGLYVRIIDLSRKVAADRWLVKVEARVAFQAECLDLLRGQFPDVDPGDWQELAEGPLLELTRERNFIDQKEVEEVRDRMVERFRENIIDYLADPSFPVKLVTRRLEDIARQRLLRQATAEAEVEDDEGPADFSHLFR